jgi:hypothetical protein
VHSCAGRNFIPAKAGIQKNEKLPIANCQLLHPYIIFVHFGFLLFLPALVPFIIEITVNKFIKLWPQT